MRYKIVLLALILSIISFPLVAQMRFATAEEAPTNYMENGKLTGTTVDIVREMIRLSGEKIEIDYFPWARAYDMVQKNENFTIFTGGKTQARIDLGLQFIGPVITRNHALISKKNRALTIKTIEDLKPYTIGGMNGDWRAKYFQDLGYKVDIATVNEQNYKKLDLDRVDFVIASDLEMAVNALKAGLKVEDLQISFIFNTASSYLLVSKQTKSVEFTKWQSHFNTVVRNGLMTKELDKWSKIVGMPMGFSAEKGFFVK